MAVKLWGVEGNPLVETDGPFEQDFLMVNSPVFAFANVEDYAVLSRVLLEDADRADRFFTERIKKNASGQPDLSDAATQRAVQTLTITQRIDSPSVSAKPFPAYQTPPLSPLDNRYFSASPYLFGAAAIVPLCLLIACSQRSGLVKNASGDITTKGTPCSSSVSHAPINPMSW